MPIHGKDYFVSKLDGEANIVRDGKQVGTWPNIGFLVEVPEAGVMKTGTILRAHAYAEVALGVPSSSRQWVMTDEEYQDDERLVREHQDGLLLAFPLTEELQSSLASWRSPEERERAKAIMRQQLMNLENGFVVPHLPRPDRYPDLHVKPRLG